jgi:hypothetical protein
MKHADHRIEFNSGNRRSRTCSRRRRARSLTGKAALAEEVARARYRDYTPLAFLGHNREPDLALMDVEDGIGRIVPSGAVTKPIRHQNA